MPIAVEIEIDNVYQLFLGPPLQILELVSHNLENCSKYWHEFEIWGTLPTLQPFTDYMAYKTTLLHELSRKLDTINLTIWNFKIFQVHFLLVND